MLSLSLASLRASSAHALVSPTPHPPPIMTVVYKSPTVLFAFLTVLHAILTVLYALFYYLTPPAGHVPVRRGRGVWGGADPRRPRRALSLYICIYIFLALCHFSLCLSLTHSLSLSLVLALSLSLSALSSSPQDMYLSAGDGGSPPPAQPNSMQLSSPLQTNSGMHPPSPPQTNSGAPPNATSSQEADAIPVRRNSSGDADAGTIPPPVTPAGGAARWTASSLGMPSPSAAPDGDGRWTVPSLDAGRRSLPSLGTVSSLGAAAPDADSMSSRPRSLPRPELAMPSPSGETGGDSMSSLPPPGQTPTLQSLPALWASGGGVAPQGYEGANANEVGLQGYETSNLKPKTLNPKP